MRKWRSDCVVFDSRDQISSRKCISRVQEKGKDLKKIYPSVCKLVELSQLHTDKKWIKLRNFRKFFSKFCNEGLFLCACYFLLSLEAKLSNYSLWIVLSLKKTYKYLHQIIKFFSILFILSSYLKYFRAKYFRAA